MCPNYGPHRILHWTVQDATIRKGITTLSGINLMNCSVDF